MAQSGSLKCLECGSLSAETHKFCSKCGTRLENPTNHSNGLVEEIKDKTDLVKLDRPVGDSKKLQILIVIVSLITIAAFVLSVNWLNEDETLPDSTTTIQSNNSELPSTDSGFSSEDELPQDTTQYVSEWYIFSDLEARNFWGYELGQLFSQDDIFVKLLFPSVTNEVQIYSIPYVQLLVWPTTEWREQEEELLNQDIYASGDTQSWVACSNVVVVFPEEEYDNFVDLNEKFCD